MTKQKAGLRLTMMYYNIKEKKWEGVGHVDSLTQRSSKMFANGCPAAWGLGNCIDKTQIILVCTYLWNTYKIGNI